LERLAAELTRRQFRAQLTGRTGELRLYVANPDHPELNEHIHCRRADDDTRCFWWPWQQPIGSVDDLAAVADKIMTVLRSVEGAS
jgi:hypothetical protein